jgi:hypothetical protein
MRVIFFLILIALLIPQPCLAEEFFPIGMFSVGPENLEIVKEAGFNTAHTYITDPVILQKYIETAEKTGIRLLIYPSDRAEQGVIDLEKAKRFIEKNRNAKPILAWYIADEPELNSGSPSQIGEINSFIKKLDRNHPTAIVIHRTDRFKEYRDASDILLIDRYPVPGRPLSHVAEAANWAVIQKGAAGPVWAVLQAFGYQNEQLKGWGLREPTYDEMRAMTYLSIIHGAKGIFYYTFTGSQYRILQSPEHWNDLKKIAAELNRLYPLFLLPNAGLKIDIEIAEGPHKDEWGVPPVHMAMKHLAKESGELKTGFYIIAANSLDKTVKAVFPISGLGASSMYVVDDFGNGSNLNIKDGIFSDIFKPYEVKIYRMVRK